MEILKTKRSKIAITKTDTLTDPFTYPFTHSHSKKIYKNID